MCSNNTPTSPHIQISKRILKGRSRSRLPLNLYFDRAWQQFMDQSGLLSLMALVLIGNRVSLQAAGPPWTMTSSISISKCVCLLVFIEPLKMATMWFVCTALQLLVCESRVGVSPKEQFSARVVYASSTGYNDEYPVH